MKFAIASIYMLAIGSLILGAIWESIVLLTAFILTSLIIIAFGVTIAGPRALNPFDREPAP